MEYSKSHHSIYSRFPTEIVDTPFGGIEPIFPNGKVKCWVSGSITDKINRAIPIETGSLDGVLYEVWKNGGGGKVQGLPNNTLKLEQDKYETNWIIDCKIDRMDDTRWCLIRRANMSVILWKDGSWHIRVGHEHYPGSAMAIRVDENKAIIAEEQKGFSDAQVKQIIQQLRTGNSFITRYQKWPYRSSIDESAEAFGFSQAIQVLEMHWKSYR